MRVVIDTDSFTIGQLTDEQLAELQKQGNLEISRRAQARVNKLLSKKSIGV